jgi:hypothetical protein
VIPEAQNLIRQVLTAESTIKDLVDLRVYASELAKVTSPVYPCVCFELDPGERGTYIKKAGLIPARFWGWSNSDFPSADEVYEAVFNFLHNAIKEDSYVRIHFTQHPTSGTRSRVQEYEEIFGIMGRWNLRIFDLS